MPEDIVDVDVTTSVAGFPEVSFGAVVVLGAIGTGTKNNPKQFFTKEEVISEHGSTSDLASAIDYVLGVKADTVYGIVAEKTAVVDELIATSNSQAVSTGTLAGTGIIDPTATISVTIDGVAKIVVYSSVETPATPGAGEVALNTKSKKFTSAEASSGAGDGIEWTYSHLDTTALFNALDNTDYEILYFAATKADLKWYGLLDAMKSHVASKEKIMVVATKKSDTVANGQKVSLVLQSDRVFAVAHQSDDDVGAIAAGVIATNPPWFTLMWKRMVGLTQTTFYNKSQTGKRNQANTFEGGDGSNLGPINAVITKAGALVLSNGLTTDGSAGTHGGWLDVTRTRDFTVKSVINELSRLRLNRGKIPFTASGLQAVRTAIQGVLDALVNNEALASYTLVVPQASQISDNDKANRKLAGIQIGAVLAGDVQEFGVQLNITV